MSSQQPSIYREQALKKYLQRQEQSVLLRLINPPVFLCCWIFLLLLLTGLVLACVIQVPSYTSEQGAIVEQKVNDTNMAEAIFFVPVGQQIHLHVGQMVTISFGSTNVSLQRPIQQISTNVVGPQEARTQYALQGTAAQVINEPSTTVTIILGPYNANNLYVGSVCNGVAQTGTQNVLSLIPGFSTIFS
jgi:hypothetical protein